jgi:hypothetical protein
VRTIQESITDELGIHKKARLSTKQLIEVIKSQKDDSRAVRYFIMVLMSKLLIPTTDFYVPKGDVWVASDLDRVAAIDWSKAVFRALNDSIRCWRQNPALSIASCVVFLVVSPSVDISFFLSNLSLPPNCYFNANRWSVCYLSTFFLTLCQRTRVKYLDNILPPRDIGLDLTFTPRIQMFTKDIVDKLVAADQEASGGGTLPFGNLPIRVVPPLILLIFFSSIVCSITTVCSTTSSKTREQGSPFYGFACLNLKYSMFCICQCSTHTHPFIIDNPDNTFFLFAANPMICPSQLRALESTCYANKPAGRAKGPMVEDIMAPAYNFPNMSTILGPHLAGLPSDQRLGLLESLAEYDRQAKESALEIERQFRLVVDKQHMLCQSVIDVLQANRAAQPPPVVPQAAQCQEASRRQSDVQFTSAEINPNDSEDQQQQQHHGCNGSPSAFDQHTIHPNTPTHVSPSMEIVPYIPPVRLEVADQPHPGSAHSPDLTQRSPIPTDSAPLTSEEVSAQYSAPDTAEEPPAIKAGGVIGNVPGASTAIQTEDAPRTIDQESHGTEVTTELPHADDTTHCKDKSLPLYVVILSSAK